MQVRLNRMGFCRTCFWDRDHDLVISAVDFHIARLHRLRQRNDLLVLTEFSEAGTATRRVFLLLFSLRHTDVQRALVINAHIDVRRLDVRQVGPELVMIIPVMKIE